jgi:heptosyltransferase-2
MQKILVIQTAFTGDVVLATAIIEKLHRFFPNASIDFLVRKGNEGLLTGHPFLNEVLIWNKKEKKTKNLFLLLKRIRAAKYDKVINLQRFASTGILTAFSNAKEKIGFNKNPLSFLFTKKIPHHFTQEMHEVERNNKLIEDFTDDSFTKPKLYPTIKNEDDIKPYTQQPMCV